jgi:GH24 family phage-related lysozyme (muramidase)
MRNLLTEVSKIKSMMGLNPNINEQSFVDVYNQLSGKSQQKQEPNFMDTWSSMGKPKDQMTPDSGGVINTIKAGAEKIAKAATQNIKTTDNNKTIQKPTGVSNKLVNFLKNIEFFVKCVYDDAKGGKCVRKEPGCCLRGGIANGKPTIGYGTTYYPPKGEDGKEIPVKPTDPDITESKALELLKARLDKDAKKILNLYPNLNQRQLDAMSSLCYQMGFDGCTKNAPNLSASLKKNPNNLQDVRKNFIDFQFPDRREKEWKIYSQGIYS